MSKWYIGNSIVGNFRVEDEIDNPKLYKIEKFEDKLYLCTEREKLLLTPIDAEAENVVNLFSYDKDESIYQIEKSKDVIVVVLYTYRDSKRIKGSQSINIHLSNADEIACLDGNLNCFSAKNMESIAQNLKELFCINNSIFVLPEKDNKNFEIFGNGIQARMRLERTGVYLLDRIRKTTNNDKTFGLVQLFGNINFISWEESTSIQCSSDFELNDVTPSEIFKSWDLYEKFIKAEYIEKLKKCGLIEFSGVQIDRNKKIISFKLNGDLNSNYRNEDIEFDMIATSVFELKIEEVFEIRNSKYLGKPLFYDEVNKVLSFEFNNNLFSIDYNSSGYLFLSKFSLSIEFKRRNMVTKAINTKANRTLNLLVKLSDKNVKDSSLGTDFNPLTEDVLKDMFNNKNVVLKENYKEAMHIAINTPDIALIQGPPGSGKTTLIKGIVSRLHSLNKNYHILVSAEQHEALYNVVDKLSHNKNIPPFISSVKNESFLGESSAQKADINERFEKNIYNFQESFIKLCDDILSKKETNEESEIDCYVDLSFLIQSIKDRNYEKEYILEILPKIKHDLIHLEIMDEVIDDLAILESKVEAVNESTVYTIIDKKVNGLILDKGEYIANFGIFKLESLQKDLAILEDNSLLINDSVLSLLGKDEVSDEIFDKYILYVEGLKKKLNNLKDNTELIASLVNDLSDKVSSFSNKLPKNIYEIVESLKYRLLDIDNSKNLIKKYTSVIGSTCAQVKKSMDYVEANGKLYDYVIVDEASHANPLDLMLPIMFGTKVILVGDHKQLPHYIETESVNNFVKSQADNKDFDSDILRESLFQILYENLELAHKEERLNFKRTIMLEEQHRMNPSIAKFISETFYDNKLKSSEKTSENVNDYDMYDGKNIVWKNVSMYDGGLETKEKQGRLYRLSEVDKIAEILRELLDKNKNRKLNVGIISYYKEQVKYIKAKLQNEFPTDIFENSIDEMVGTVDSFQGKEFDIVIISGVRCNDGNEPRKRLGFINDEHCRINVSLTRAKKLLIFVADEETFGKNELFQRLINHIKTEGYYEE